MLLKDCPVGSFVRLVSFDGDIDWSDKNWWWRGEFEVFSDGYGKYVITNDLDQYYAEDCDNFQFSVESTTSDVSDTKTLTINDKTYKLKPHTKPRLTVVDGVTYEMELV